MKRDYLSRLALAARWYLPPEEAAEVLEDYREIVEGRSEEELRRDLGTPRAVARQLVQPKAYRRWLAVLLALMLCGEVPVLMMMNSRYWTFLVWPVQWVGLCLGMVLSALWFRRNGVRERARPKAILPLLALLLAGMAWVWVITGAVVTESWDMLHFLAPTVERARLLHGSLIAGIGAAGLLGIFGLTGARLGDRRWLAVYALGLTGMLLFLSVRGLMTLMVAFTPEILRAFLAHQVFLTAAGLIGTGVSLYDKKGSIRDGERGGVMKWNYRLSRAARWYLPPAEAAEVLEDYKELIEQDPRPEERLLQDIGTPKDAVGQLVQLKAYHRWLMVFTVLAVCAAVPAAGPICSQVFWGNGENGVYRIARLAWAFLAVGTVLSFLWFQRNGRREGTLPKGIFLTMAVPLAGMVWAWFITFVTLYRLDPMTQFMREHPGTGPLIHCALLSGGFIMGLTGLFGLLKARLEDRRWRAVYVWGLAGTLLSLAVWALLSSMSLDATTSGWQTSYLLRYAFITLLGLIGTGVSLC